MIVWIVTESVPYEYTEILSVWASEESAKKERDRLESEDMHHYFRYSVEPYEVRA